ncbi:uncharacterized protein LOC128256776 [Drosophila gunungcola]|uniref:Uncharacterized protein n=1 Tax=Drosophila gunungcola TaxID=103775 RepID=A0A9P9YF05_9MUSC|nr:uncharacterized protein LOC128256776 [Drosophila gunungcola]KAI8035771.1 hypothetical protein M5D96_011521 [Drosophila gunungcola]
MADVLEEYITLTPLTCVQQCNALLGTTSGKPKSCFVFFTLFGAYCGVLVYRAYRSYASKQGGDGEKISEGIQLEAKAEFLNVEPGSSLVNEFLDRAQPILLQPVEFSSTDMRWRYCSQRAKPDFRLGGSDSDDEAAEKNVIEELDSKSNVVDEVEPTTSTTKPEGHMENVDGKHHKTTTFSV